MTFSIDQHGQFHYKPILSVSYVTVATCPIQSHQQDQTQNVTEYHSARLSIKASEHNQTVQIVSSREEFHLNSMIIIKVVIIL